MKSRLLILGALVGLLFAGSAMAQSDAFGVMDTVALVKVGDPATGHFQVQLWVFSDETLSGSTTGFVWDNPKVQLDSVSGGAALVGSFDQLFFYEAGSLATTNLNQRFLFGTLAFFTSGLAPSSSRRLWGTFWFNTTGWTESDVVTVDTATWGGGTDYLYVEFTTNGEIQPVFGGSVTGTDEGSSETPLPTSYALRQNYPNPFNPTTQISFDLPARSHVRLTVFNILGQEVEVLVDREMDAQRGATVTWNGANQASGVYFYKIEADSFTETRKMLLIK